ncbi:MAG: amidohydrolase family protein [Actinomycetota bacterium]|nr:amidohydrolase family protein [Actinomycetota bacterium]MDQ6945713.1 amidohydrolase family protein [Actinomycetota bacterium]
MTPDTLTDLVAGLELIDHHCHSVVGHGLDRPSFEGLLGEADRPAPAGCSTFDTSLGLALRSWCAPLLDLPAGVDSETYLERRAELGASEVNARMLAGGARQLLVDTGYRSDELASLAQLAIWADGMVQEIARLETMGEEVARTLFTGGGGASAAYADRLTEAVAHRAPGTVAWKSIAAYRGGLDLDWRRPAPSEVRNAASEWLSAGRSEGRGGPTWRLEHPVLVCHGVWAAIDTGLPVQFHTGFGDTDAPLLNVNPTLLSDLIAATADAGSPIMLLHCWPYHREAAYLSHVWPHVHLDVGETLPHVGHRGAAVLAETLELAPWHKVLYSSDAFGLGELYHLGVVTHRRALASVLAPLAGMGFDRVELGRLGALVTSGNATRVYRVLGSDQKYES